MIRATIPDVDPFIYIITKTKLAGTQFLDSLLDPRITNYKYIGTKQYAEYKEATKQFSTNPTQKNFERYKSIQKYIRREILVPENDFFYKFLTYTKIQRKDTVFSSRWANTNFEYSIFVFDEIHEAEGNNAETIITSLRDKNENIRLILLSATPANTNASEFVSILNMLRPVKDRIEKNDYFDPKTNMPLQGTNTLEKLGQLSSGYVSYIKITNDLFPENIDMGELRKPFKYLKLVRCKATQQHQKRLLREMKDNGLDTIDKIMTNYQTINDWDTVFPSGPNSVEFYTEKAFANRNPRIKIEVSEENNKIDINDPNLLDLDNVEKVSPKIFTFLKTFFDPKNVGIHYAIHSQIINGGIQLYVNALKINGVIPYGQHDIANARCYFCKRWFKDHKKITDHEFHPATFLALYRKVDEVDRIRAVNVLKAPENKMGKNACLLIGSNIIRQSIDLTNVRYVHILCSQESLSMDEQIRGRASRLNSHMLLPPEMRNVRIYRYVIDAPILAKYFKGGDAGGIYNPEEYKYWRQEKNFMLIQELEYQIKRYAMDCQINKYINVSDFLKRASKKDKRKFQLMCNFHDCNYRCVQPKPAKSIKNRDTSTLSFINDAFLIKECTKVVTYIMKRTPALRLPDLMDEIIDVMTRNDSGFVPILDSALMLYVVFKMVTAQSVFYNILHQPGTLKWYDGAIFFVPLIGASENPLRNLKHYKTSNTIALENIPGMYDKYDINAIHDDIIEKLSDPSLTITGFIDTLAILTPDDRQMIVEELILGGDKNATANIIRAYGKFIITKDILNKSTKSFRVKTAPSLSRFKNNEIIGHCLNGKFRCISKDGKGWDDCVGNAFVISPPTHALKLARYVGFEDFNRSGEIIFKVLFNDTANEVDNRKKRKGVDCLSIQLGSVKKEWAKFFDISPTVFEAPGKRKLCNVVRDLFVERNENIRTEVSFMNNLEILFARMTNRIGF